MSLEMTQSRINTFARRVSETARRRYSLGIVLTKAVRETWELKNRGLAEENTRAMRESVSDDDFHSITKGDSDNFVTASLHAPDDQDVVTCNIVTKSESCDGELSQELIREGCENETVRAQTPISSAVMENAPIKRGIEQTLTPPEVRQKEGSMTRSVTADNIFQNRKKVLKPTKTWAIFSNLIEGKSTNPEIDTLLETDHLHQESLEKKNALRDIVDEIQRRKVDSYTHRDRAFPPKRHVHTNCSRSSTSTKDSGEILTLFDAMQGLNAAPHAYWIGCSYSYQSSQNKLEVKIRQTGVHPRIFNESGSGKIILKVSLSSRKSQRHSVCLMKSASDNSFKSHTIVFKPLTDDCFKQQNLRLKVFFRAGAFKNEQIDEWCVPLQRCEPNFEKSDWRRCEF